MHTITFNLSYIANAIFAIYEALMSPSNMARRIKLNDGHQNCIFKSCGAGPKMFRDFGYWSISVSVCSYRR